MNPNATPDAQRELAGADLSEALHAHLLAPFLDMAEAGPALTAAAVPGDDLVLQLDPVASTWCAVQHGAVLMASQLDPGARQEVAELTMHALTAALNAEPASRREVLATSTMGAAPFAALRITATQNTTTVGLCAGGRVLFAAHRAVECSPQNALKAGSVH